jgi:hypothetical protein
METFLRLDSVSPSLAAAYRRADNNERRCATLAACCVAVAQAGLAGSEVDAALAHLRQGGSDRSDVRERLDHLAARLDEQYFDLSEGHEATTLSVLIMFRKARAAAAIAFALSPNSEQLHEAIYEAIAASSDQTETIRAAETALKKETL